MPESSNKEYTMAIPPLLRPRTHPELFSLMLVSCSHTSKIRIQYSMLVADPGRLPSVSPNMCPKEALQEQTILPKLSKGSKFCPLQDIEDDGKSRGKVEFVVRNVLERLPFEDDAFDTIFSSQVMSHLGDHSVKALKELRRVLKSGGILSSRDGARLHVHPSELNLDHLFRDNLCKAVGVPGFSSPKMAAFYRAVGFDVAGGQVRVRTGSNCVSGKAGNQGPC
jgi:hypothetical protein